MPRKKSNGMRVTSTHDNQVISSGSSSGRGQRRSLEATLHSAKRVSRRTQGSNQEVPIWTVAKRKNAGQTPYQGKRHGRTESGADTEAEDTPADDIDTPLTRARIPTIVNAVLSNITTDSTGAGGEMEDTPDNAPLSKCTAN